MTVDENKNSVVIIAPFWKMNYHIGRYRIERMVKWLISEDYNVKIIWSGWKDNILVKNKLIELEIRDSLRRFTKKTRKFQTIIQNQNGNEKRISLRSIVQKIVFYFDREFIWSLRVTRNDLVQSICKNSKFIISSSPPESIHLASYLLAERYNLKLVIDMRDGWLDEPMRTYRTRLSIKKRIEKRWEYMILRKASRVFVTSDNWADMLKQRIPTIENNIRILTNAYPADLHISNNVKSNDKLTAISLLHTGRFLGTRSTNRMSILLEPLYNVLKNKNEFVTEIVLLGDLLKNDVEELIHWEQEFIITNTKLISKNRIPRDEMYTELANADGLLLLAATKAFFPSKTFEYIKSAKPILAVTIKGSTIWQIGQNLPQMFLYDFADQEQNYSPIEKFLMVCESGDYKYKVPEEFSEEYTSRIFLNTINDIK